MSRHKEPKAETSEEAAHYLNEARLCREMAADYHNPSFLNQAAEFEAAAEAYLVVAEPPAVGAGGEFEVPETAELGLQQRLNQPNRVNILASDDRIALLADTETVDLGLDLAESIEARNSLEKLLAHQMAMAHKLAMRFARRAQMELWRQGDPEAVIEVSRCANASARLTRAFQDSALTLAKLRTGGQQVVTVQHVNVEPGGQAVVAGNVGHADRGAHDQGSE